MIGTGVSRIEVIATLRGPSAQSAVPCRAASLVPLASVIACSPAVRPSRRASFHTLTVCVPSATRFSAAWSPSWPETGTGPAMPCAARAAMAPPAVPSFDATTASTLLRLAVRNCSMLRCALAGSQPSV